MLTAVTFCGHGNTTQRVASLTASSDTSPGAHVGDVVEQIVKLRAFDRVIRQDRRLWDIVDIDQSLRRYHVRPSAWGGTVFSVPAGTVVFEDELDT